MLPIYFLLFWGDVVTCVVSVTYTFFSVFWGAKENGSAYSGSFRGLRGSFAEDAVPAEVFVRTWDGMERRTEQDFSHVPFWSPGNGDSVPQGRGPDSG